MLNSAFHFELTLSKEESLKASLKCFKDLGDWEKNILKTKPFILD